MTSETDPIEPTDVPAIAPVNAVAPIEPSVEPIDDEVDEPEPAPSEPKEESSQTDRIFLGSLTKDDLASLIDLRRKILGDAEFEAEIKKPGSYDALLIELSSRNTIEVDRIIKSIDAIGDKSLFDTRLVRDGKVILGTQRPNRPAGTDVTVSGADAKITFAIMSGRLKRIPLYNSGFSIDVTESPLDMLNAWQNRAHDLTNAYGRQFGGLFYFFHDLMIKEACVDLILPLILNSTCRGFNRGDTLVRAIKLVDLKMILNGLAALLFPAGFTYTHICQNPSGKCTHHETLKIDINKFARYDFGKMSDYCIQHMHRVTDVTPELLSTYHQKLGFDGREIRYKNYGFTLKVPSLFDYLEYGRIYNGELLSKVFVDNPDAIFRAVSYSYYRLYAPYVAKVTFYNDDGTVCMSTSDQSTITLNLLQIQAEDREESLMKAFEAFINATEIGYVSYPAVPCPVCKFVPGSGHHNVDPMIAFFIQSAMKLTPL